MPAHRTALRLRPPPAGDPFAAIHAALNTMNVVDLTRGDMLAAGTHAPLRSNDAIPLAVAIRLGTDEIATYDGELADAAKAAGLAILAPDA